MAGSWNYMICKFPSNPNHSGITGLFGFQLEPPADGKQPKKGWKETWKKSLPFVSPLQWLLTRVVGRVLECLWKLLEQRKMFLLSNCLHTLVCITSKWDFLEIQPYFSSTASNLVNFPYI